MSIVPGSSLPELDRRLEDQVVNHIYDVALDPSKYGDLLDVWEEMIGPQRRRAQRIGPLKLLRPDLGLHFRRLAEILERTHDVKQANPEDVELSAHPRVAAFCVGPDMTISAANYPTQELLGIRQGASVDDLPMVIEDRSVLINAVKRHFAARENHESVLLRLRVLTRPDSDNDAAQSVERPVLVRLRHGATPGGLPFAVVVTSLVKWPATLTETLIHSFGLTASELDVLRGLTESLTLKDIADQRGRSIETVRAQVKALLQKTETHSQSELVRLALTTMDIAAPTATTSQSSPRWSTGTATLAARRFKTINRPDGRKVDYLVLGDPNGKPMFFMHGFLGIARWPAKAEAEAARQNLRVIVPVRPGYGMSTPLAQGVSRLTAVAGDIQAIANAERAKRFPMIVLRDDLIYAAAFHALDPGRLTGVLGCAAALPSNKAEHFERMGKWHRFFYSSASFTPHLLPFMIRAGFAMVRRGGKRRFLEAVLEDSSSDLALLNDPEIMETLEIGTEITINARKAAVAGFSAEFHEDSRNDALALVEAMRDLVPIHMFHGPEDLRNPPETVKEMRLKYPWINFHDMETGGMLLFFGQWKRVLEALKPLIP
ncbi:MAG: LuxR C-terminal-related transcriptional regulator [Pseudooceanicola sp.]